MKTIERLSGDCLESMLLPVVVEITSTVARSEGPLPGPAAGTTVAEEREYGAKGPSPIFWRTANTAGSEAQRRTERQTGKQAERETDGQTDRQTHRQAD